MSAKSVGLALRKSGRKPRQSSARTASSARVRIRSFSSAGLLALLAALLVQTGGQAQAPGQVLPYFTSYSVVGDYAIGNVDLSQATAADGFVNGTIYMTA